MASPFTAGKFQAIGLRTDGTYGVSPGALLYTYAAGTTNPLATYTTAALSSANSNPVICDSAGQADVWPSATSYHWVLKTAAGVVIWDEDNWTAPSASADSSLIDSYTGVDPTGAADSAAAINTAIATASAAGVKKLRFPGTYKILSQVTLASNMVFEFSGTINLNVTEVGFLIPAAASKITIDGLGTGLITGTCSKAISSVLASTVTDIRIRNLSITGATLAGLGYTNGIFLDGATRVWIENNRLYGNGIGASTATGNGDITIYTNTNSFVYVLRNVCTSTLVGFNIAVYNATEAHIDFNTCIGAVCGSANNNGYGILLYSSTTDACKRASVNGNVVENTGGTGIYIQDVVDVTVGNNVMLNVAQTQADTGLPVGGVAFNGCTNAASIGNVIDTSGKAGVTTTGGVRITIVGGSAKNCLGPGYYLRGTGDGTVISGVLAEDCAYNIWSDATAKAGIVIEGVTSRLSKTTFRGIELGNVSGARITGVSSNNARSGLVILAGANNSVSMVCMDNSTESANTYDGIGLACTSSKVFGCRSGNSGATGQRYGVNSTGNYCTIQNNDCTRNQTDGCSLSGTAIQTGGNRQSLSATPGATQGSGVLVGGTVTITTDEVRTADLIVLTCVAAGGTQGIARVSTITNATSFVITSSQGADTSTYQYQIIH